MLTTRISPKISVKPLATTKYSAAGVRPLSSVMKKSFGSETAEPKLVPDAMNRTQMTGRDDQRQQRPATSAPQRPVCSELRHSARP